MRSILVDLKDYLVLYVLENLLVLQFCPTLRKKQLFLLLLLTVIQCKQRYIPTSLP
jgi:hypothetical protein